MLTDLLKHHFGHSTFRPGQEEVILHVLERQNTLALFPTGGGKSLCYQLPALAQSQAVIVISPLLALMKDQVDLLNKRGISALRLDSTLTDEERTEAEAQIRQQTVKLIFLSPERLANPHTLALLKSISPSLVAIDEAHCFSEWGQSFRPDYRRLPGLIRKLKPRSILALTATATRPVMRDICKGFKIPQKHVVKLSYARPNLSWHVTYAADEDQKRTALLETLQTNTRLPSIIYCSRQATTEHVAHFLTEKGISAKAFNAGIPTHVRAELLTGYLADEFPVIVATIAFGMGVDKPNVRSVIHYDLPRSPEGWMQESGRAGRDGSQSHTRIIASLPDLIWHQNITYAAEPSKLSVERILSNIFTGEKQAVLSPYSITTQLDVSRQVFDTILTYLETDRIISFHSLHHRKVRIQTLRPIREIQKQLSANSPLKNVIGVRGWIDLQEHFTSITQLVKISSTLTELELAGDISIHRSHQLHVYSIKKAPADLSALITRFYDHFSKNTEYEIARIHSVEKILTSRRCIKKALLDHLGEKNSPPCGKCSRCLKDPLKTKLPGPVAPTISEETRTHIHTLTQNLPVQLRTPIQLTRFLLGISTPASRTARLTRRNEFGILENQSWKNVLAISTASL